MLKVFRTARRVWHVAAKIIAFFFFGAGSLVLALIVIPVLRFLLHPRERFRRAVRSAVRGSFIFFVFFMKALRLISVRIDKPDVLAGARRLLICANHPSLIDIVILISLVPRADCIVKAGLWKNIFMMNIVRSVYIPNSLDPEETFRACAETIAAGNNLIIFPEGTRTGADGKINLQRNAARISLRTGRPILPVRIHADEPFGLRKSDSLFAGPASGIVRYVLEVLPTIDPSGYTALPEPKAARMLTNKMKEAIVGAAQHRFDAQKTPIASDQDGVSS